MKNYDFSGWATRANLKCSDGRTILKDAFKNNDGEKVPLVWNHQHNDPMNVLGHAVLENRESGVYAYCTFNDTDSAKNAKLLVSHGDIHSLSIYANKLKHQGSLVTHGAIREVSLVLAGANPGAFIDSVIKHGEESDEEAVIYTGETISLYHSEKNTSTETSSIKEDSTMAEAKAPAINEKDDPNETVADVFNTLTEKQKTVVYAIIGEALSEKDDDNDEGDDTVKHNIFDGEDYDMTETLSHAEMTAIFQDAKRYGSLKDSVIQHGIEDIDFLFPDATNLEGTPSFITRDMTWVKSVMNGFRKSPFSRIKSMFADITEDDARAKGYLKGKLKKEEFFSLLKRTTTPTTVYKKQKLDRDDVVDIVDFDVVAWLKSEMRVMLDEEIARAALVGDGRLASSDDKINEMNIRPIWTDDDLYTIKATVTLSPTSTSDQKAKAFIREVVKSRKDYKGSGNPSLYTTEDVLTDCLLMEDTTGRVIYDSIEKLATALRVKEIVTVPVMEGLTKDDKTLMGIVVNLADYNIGADKGGAVNMFDDFDIDYNAQKYLIETRCSGALIRPYSAIAISSEVVGG